jgi:hypothetical protein
MKGASRREVTRKRTLLTPLFVLSESRETSGAGSDATGAWPLLNLLKFDAM